MRKTRQMGEQTPRNTASAIADAAIRLIARDGFDTVSVRHVAQEAGLAPGTVQHHFPTRDALLTVALERTINRQIERISDFPAIRDAFRIAQRGLRTFLPMDPARREEAIVWIAFSAAASTRPSLRQAHAEGVALLRRQIRHVLEYAHEVGQTRDGFSLERDTVILAATIDGLILHGINSDDNTTLLAVLDQAISQVIEPGS
jgi:AcrR family transcriptional regulator